MLDRYWQALVDRLDRPGRRALLVVPGSLWVSLKYRRPCLVYWRAGAWIHHYRGAKIPHATLGRAAPPHVFTREAREIFLYEYAPRAGDIVFDIGAGVGAETLVFSRLVGASGRVVSVEAHPRTYERLVELCRANELANVTPLQMAVSDGDGAAVISDRAHHARNALVKPEAGGVDVPARRIDTIARDLGIARIDLLKMNVEGAERTAIWGVGALLADTRHVCISCHDFLADDGGADELRTKALVRDFLVDHGFRVMSRDDAPEPWTRDYLYGVNALPRSPTAELSPSANPTRERARDAEGSWSGG
jgi:FkbM family methyltransferase